MMKINLFDEVTETKEQLTRDIRKADAGKLSSMLTNFCLAFLCLIAMFLSLWSADLTFTKATTNIWISLFTYIITVIIYQTKYQGGYSSGKGTEEYRKATERFEIVRGDIVEKQRINELTKWCENYRREELTTTRRELVTPYMLYEDYLEIYAGLDEKAVKKMKIPLGMKGAIIRANNLKIIRLDASQLMERSADYSVFGNKRNPLPKNRSDRMKDDYIRNAITRLVTMLFCGFVTVKLMTSPSMETILTCMIYMSPVVGAFVGGYGAGYRNATLHDIARIEAQTSLIERFFEDTTPKIATEN